MKGGPRFDSVEDALDYSEKADPDPDVGRHTNLEGLIRRSARADLVFELKSGLDCGFKGVPLRTNSFGFRGREWRLEKAPGTLRIALVGDSVVFGPFVAEEEIFASLLGQRIESATRGAIPRGRIETLNFGVPGYNATQEAELFAVDVPRFAPDMVVVGYVGNDDQLPSFIEDILDRSSGGLLRRSLFFEELASMTKEEKRQLVRGTRELILDERIPGEYRRMIGWPAIEAAYRRMGAVAKAQGLRVLVTIYESEAGPDHDPHPRASRHEKLARLGEEIGFELLDMTAVFGRIARERGWRNIVPLWVNDENGHLNAEGHRLFADALAEKLASLGWLGDHESLEPRYPEWRRGGDSNPR